ncbi:ParM/StbA family protein [Clostridium sp. JN-9]|uniref:ParM/StbA family protein n=1 Tax=Clostridium sp. JN-9 TaxID=2507159 RepID=UPI000FFE0C6C|nr:ParM/StbA family protein [Clostridium sp. JN-9]QAT40813.1 ParM/StbA family protein [Clostridium sp. JN-9]
MIIGYDGGYTYIKDSEGHIFPAKVTTKESLIGKSNYIEMNKIKYYIGDGENAIALNKINCELTKACLLYALSLNDEVEFNVVTGLPIGQYKSQRNQLKELLLSNKFNRTNINGKERTIIINNVEIFPQAAGAGYTINPMENYIIGDIGGRTFDVCLFQYFEGKRKLTKYSTILEGTLSLYADVVKEINQKFETDLRIEEGENILNKGLSIYGEKQNLSFLKPIIESHLNNIINELIMNYPIKTSRLYLTGGGTYLYGQAIQNKMPGTKIMGNCQFNNCLGFKNVGVSLWQED